jgi:abequosyltransferase
MEVLLTLAIPTYNRADSLDKSLFSLINDPSFDSRVEIIISDNCSTDNTTQIAKKYTTHYSNVRYHRNNVNIGGDLNFCQSLQIGMGKYIKLCNDTIQFKNGFLQFMLTKIEENQNTNTNIFFYGNYFYLRNKDVICENVDDFTRAASFTSTWIGNFGIWKKDIQKLEPLNQYASTKLLQVGWTYELIKSSRQTILYFRDFSDVVITNDKGGYNVFKVFIENYLGIVRTYSSSGFIRLKTFEINKFRLFANFISIRMCWLIIKSKNIRNFENKGAWKIIFKEYGYYPYFYLGFLFIIPLTIKEKIKPLKDFINRKK